MQSSFLVKINEKKNDSPKICISLPIDIVKSENNKNETKSDCLDNEECSLKFNNFDPNKMSPPSEWKARLENRIKIHYTYNLEKE